LSEWSSRNGAVSPNGVGNAAFAEGVLQGRSGCDVFRTLIHRKSRADAGEVRDFDELAWVEKESASMSPVC